MPSLPPHARSRLERFAVAHARTSLLTVPAAAGVEAVGFEPVGEVMGGIVRQLNLIRAGSCGAVNRSTARTLPVRLVSHASSPYRSYANALRGGLTTALDRLRQEATALGADGVIGVRLGRTRIGDTYREFTAFGTAVRARSRTRPGTVFTTDLDGPDFAKLLLGGAVPTQLHVALEVAVRHDDWGVYDQTRQARRRQNLEVDGLTALVTAANASVRTQLQRAIASSGADGGLLSSFESRTWPDQCDHVAEVLATGTAVARFGPARHVGTLNVIPVRPRTPQERR